MPELGPTRTADLPTSPFISPISPSPYISPHISPNQVRSCPSWDLLAQHVLPAAAAPAGYVPPVCGPPVVSAQLEPHGVLPRRRQLLICRKSGEVLQWDVPSLATSLAEGACNALVEKELSKMTPQHQHEEAPAIYPPYQHE